MFGTIQNAINSFAEISKSEQYSKAREAFFSSDQILNFVSNLPQELIKKRHEMQVEQYKKHVRIDENTDN